MHTGEESIAPSSAALLGVIGHKLGPLMPDTVDIRRFPDHQSFMVDARLHDADIVSHDEQDIRL
jgi:hypothetical protein